MVVPVTGSHSDADEVGIVMSDQERDTLSGDAGAMELEQRDRRNFLVSLGKWSKALIGSVLLGGLLAPERDARAWG